MIIVTGAFGFIGSCLCAYLRKKGHTDILAVDDFSKSYKSANLPAIEGLEKLDRSGLFKYLKTNKTQIEAIWHMGARTDTTEQNEDLLDALNTAYTKELWEFCSSTDVPLFYASSAATYGIGDHGYSDNHALVPRLEPLNPYGWSKQLFDLWALNQGFTPPRWYGFKFFNVYGPNEYHKGRMASVIFHSVNQIKTNGYMNLFKSHRADFEDGQQSRDFIYIKDVLDMMYWFYEHKSIPSGLYNVGTGIARTFEDLVSATFNAMDLQPIINYIDTPEDIRENYQYFTEADLTKVQGAGYKESFTSLEDGVADYLRNFLLKNQVYH